MVKAKEDMQTGWKMSTSTKSVSEKRPGMAGREKPFHCNPLGDCYQDSEVFFESE